MAKLVQIVIKNLPEAATVIGLTSLFTVNSIYGLVPKDGECSRQETLRRNDLSICVIVLH